MAIIRISKSFYFEMAHALWNHDGSCRHIHGHSFELLVTIKGSPNMQPKHPKNGMVWDFSALKEVIEQEVIRNFDHALLLNADSKNMSETENLQMFDRVVFVDYQPTCENILLDIVERIKNHLPADLKLCCLKLSETPFDFAQWYADDNE